MKYSLSDSLSNLSNPLKVSFSKLTSAGLIDGGNIDNSIFGTGKFFKEQSDQKKESIYSNIDDMLNSTLKPEEDE